MGEGMGLGIAEFVLFILLQSYEATASIRYDRYPEGLWLGSHGSEALVLARYSQYITWHGAPAFDRPCRVAVQHMMADTWSGLVWLPGGRLCYE